MQKHISSHMSVLKTYTSARRKIRNLISKRLVIPPKNHVTETNIKDFPHLIADILAIYNIFLCSFYIRFMFGFTAAVYQEEKCD